MNQFKKVYEQLKREESKYNIIFKSLFYDKLFYYLGTIETKETLNIIIKKYVFKTIQDENFKEFEFLNNK